MQAGVARWFGSRRLIGALALAAVAAGLGGCSPSLAEAKFETSDVSGAIARGEMHSPKSAAIAFSSIEGAPADVVARFREGVTADAGRREVTITDPSAARYFVRGYLDAFPTETGTSVHTVWDVFDTDKRRVERLDDGLDLPASGGDPWSGVDDKVMAALPARSRAATRAYLATTPEAIGTPAAPGK